MTIPDPRDFGGSRGADAGARSAFGAVTRALGRLGMVGATAVLVLFAILLAEAAHYAIVSVRGESFNLGFVFDVAAVTILVATPIVVYAQTVIRELGSSRRALRRVTERLAVAVEAAEQASVAKTRFLANMSHELRTPLNAIIGFADMIQAQHHGPVAPRYLEYLKDIGQSGHHLLGIINDILDYSKIEAGRATLQDEEEFNLAAVIDATLRMTRPLAERQKVTVEASGDIRRFRLLAVERMVCQILLNLLSNAIKFTGAGGRVTVSAARTAEGALLLAVTDTGLGMTPAEIEVALTPFGQVGNAFTKSHVGTGLGLPLAKAMMELHGGELRITSAPGQGTTVALTFPAERVLLQSETPAADAAAHAATVVPFQPLAQRVA